MDYLQALLESSNIPILTAFVLGLMTAISPCPLATNITATAFIAKNITNKKLVFMSGFLYSLGRAFKTLGFKDIVIKSFNDSDILNFNNYELDIKKDGTPYKGDSSLYIEARK